MTNWSYRDCDVFEDRPNGALYRVAVCDTPEIAAGIVLAHNRLTPLIDAIARLEFEMTYGVGRWDLASPSSKADYFQRAVEEHMS